MENDQKLQPKKQNEVELSNEQLARNDEIWNAALEFCKVLTENPDLEWDMAFIGEITDIAAETLVAQGYKVRYPSVVTDDDGSQHVEEFYGD